MLVDDETNAYLHEGGALATIDGSDDALYMLDDALGSVLGVTDEAGLEMQWLIAMTEAPADDRE